MFVEGTGILPDTEFIDTPVFTQSADRGVDVAIGIRAEMIERIEAAYQRAKIVIRVVCRSAWLAILRAVYSYRKQPVSSPILIHPTSATDAPASNDESAPPLERRPCLYRLSCLSRVELGLLGNFLRAQHLAQEVV